jgi:hypothetical protein
VWQFYCSWPVGSLSPKSTQPEGIKLRAQRDQRVEALLLAQKHLPLEQVKAKPLKIHLQFIRPNKADRNLIDTLASCQCLLQGIAQATNANMEQLHVTADMDAPPVRPGGVRVTIHA